METGKLSDDAVRAFTIPLFGGLAFPYAYAIKAFTESLEGYNQGENTGAPSGKLPDGAPGNPGMTRRLPAGSYGQPPFQAAHNLK